MNRTPAIVLALLLLAMGIIVVLLFVHSQNLPDGAQAAVNAYIQYRQPSISLETLAIGQTAYAGNPSQFDAQMSGASFGESRFYRTTYTYQNEPAVDVTYASTSSSQNDALALSDSLKVTAYRKNGTVPIPFPPVELWCVVLNEAAKPPSVAFVALHRDLYYAEWLVHEPSSYADIGELNRRLSSVDCNLEVGQAH